MATGLQAQTVAAQDATFQQKVRDAIVAAAISIYNEATTLTASVRSGTATPTLAITPALGSAIAANTVLRVGQELLLTTAGAAAGATTIAVSTTTTIDHLAGEAVCPPTVVNHIVRASFARLVLANPDAQVPAFAAALASAGIDVNSTDAAINNQVSADWNAIAGA